MLRLFIAFSFFLALLFSSNTFSVQQGYAQQQQASPGGNGTASADDEVVEDADYEVIDEEEAKTS